MYPFPLEQIFFLRNFLSWENRFFHAPLFFSERRYMSCRMLVYRRDWCRDPPFPCASLQSFMQKKDYKQKHPKDNSSGKHCFVYFLSSTPPK